MDIREGTYRHRDNDELIVDPIHVSGNMAYRQTKKGVSRGLGFYVSAHPELGRRGEVWITLTGGDVHHGRIGAFESLDDLIAALLYARSICANAEHEREMQRRYEENHNNTEYHRELQRLHYGEDEAA